jgi:hypothetical protein
MVKLAALAFAAILVLGFPITADAIIVGSPYSPRHPRRLAARRRHSSQRPALAPWGWERARNHQATPHPHISWLPDRPSHLGNELRTWLNEITMAISSPARPWRVGLHRWWDSNLATIVESAGPPAKH